MKRPTPPKNDILTDSPPISADGETDAAPDSDQITVGDPEGTAPDSPPIPQHQDSDEKTIVPVYTSREEEIEAVARQVIDGLYGHGQERRRNLAASGYNPNEIHREVIRLRNQ